MEIVLTTLLYFLIRVHKTKLEVIHVGYNKLVRQHISVSYSQYEARICKLCRFDLLSDHVHWLWA